MNTDEASPRSPPAPNRLQTCPGGLETPVLNALPAAGCCVWIRVLVSPADPPGLPHGQQTLQIPLLYMQSGL